MIRERVETPHYFFCGIGGNGMSAIAQALLAQGCRVSGSDRNYDRGLLPDLYDTLTQQGASLFPQDGSGIHPDLTALVVSTAIEDTVPDIAAAKRHGVAIRHRAEMLADIVHQHETIAVGGTSGKSTVTGMIGHLLAALELDPTVINGGIMQNFTAPPLLGNARPGGSDLLVIEADESDGTLARYSPAVSLITNVTLDHKPLAELRPLFTEFANRATTAAVINADCPETSALPITNKTLSFSLTDKPADFQVTDVTAHTDGMHFRINDRPARIPQPGRHNVANAAAAVTAIAALGKNVDDAVAALADFRGIRRRLEFVGIAKQIAVIDDYAHNPDKIAAALAALRDRGRLLVMYQPHGFGPTRFLMDGLIEAFSNGLTADDLLVMPDIFYAGGTAAKDVSSRQLLDRIAKANVPVKHTAERLEAGHCLLDAARPGDTIVVMGARDDTLADFARDLLAQLKEGALSTADNA